MGKVVKNYRSGQVQATIWGNEGQNGVYNTVTFKRSYKDPEGHWKDVSGFRTNDLSDVAILTRVVEQELKLRVVENQKEGASAPSSLSVVDGGVVE